MTPITNPNAYRFLAEVLLYPQDRNFENLESYAEAAVAASPGLQQSIASILTDPEWDDCDPYLQTFEIAPRAPLYLGHYLFEEPRNCRGAAISGRNNYMIQLKNVYRHFGFELQGGELPDFLPAILDFLALSADHPDQKRRQWMIRVFVKPALPSFIQALRKVNNVYSHVAGILEALINAELVDTAAQRSEAAAALA
ncbi:MAG: molecular chaperone TorD family protein [Verrucomicrobia bacterium]|nr:molecular chaperone TorD family protein [Verrucomicrobiota bacterium]